MIRGSGSMTTAAIRKLVAELEPFFFDESLESSDRAIIRVEKQLRQSRDLGRSVPSVGAVDEDGASFVLDGGDDDDGGFHDGTHALQPLGVLQLRQPGAVASASGSRIVNPDASGIARR